MNMYNKNIFARLRLTILLEFKNMKFFALQIFMSFIVMPLGILFVLLAQENVDAKTTTYLLSGFIISSLIGSFFATLSLRISNMMMAEILELYATFSLSRWEMVAGMSIAFVLMTLPQIGIAGFIVVMNTSQSNLISFILSILFSIVGMLLMAVWAGLKVKNYYMAMGLFPFASWILILISPIYYDLQNIPTFLQWLLLANPLSHLLFLIRFGAGFAPPIPLIWSIIFLFFVFFGAAIGIHKELKQVFILEKF